MKNTFAQRILAYKKVTAALFGDLEKILSEVDVEFFTADSMVVVQIDDQQTVNDVVEALDKKYELRIASPSVYHRPSFALVGPKLTVRRVGSVLQLYGTR